MADDYQLELFKAALSLLVAIIGISATWYAGTRLTTSWNLRQKRRELNVEAVHALHELYGEFKEVVKIWRLVKRPLTSPTTIPSEERWNLLVRACSIESKTEALVLRLATERNLKDGDADTIGFFRQAMQLLRECIRDNVDCPLGSRREEYGFLNELAPQMASIVTDDLPKTRPSVELAERQLADIVAVTSKSWAARIAVLKGAADKPDLTADEDEDA